MTAVHGCDACRGVGYIPAESQNWDAFKQERDPGFVFPWELEPGQEQGFQGLEWWVVPGTTKRELRATCRAGGFTWEVRLCLDGCPRSQLIFEDLAGKAITQGVKL